MNSWNVSYYKRVSYLQLVVGEGILTPDIDVALALGGIFGLRWRSPGLLLQEKLIEMV